jgi:uncharacterized protein (TIGR03437 family)
LALLGRKYWLLAFLILPLPLFSQGIITTLAGTDWLYPFDPVPGPDAPIGLVYTLAVDRAGNIFIADSDNAVILKLDGQGIVSVVAGNGLPGFSGDGGPAIRASITRPSHVAFDTEGNLYIPDGSRIRRVDRAGIISTIAGTGRRGYSGDGGNARNADLSAGALAIGPDNSIYFAQGPRIRRIRPDGIITTIAGNGQEGYSGDGGPALQAALNEPGGLAFDASGNLYVAERANTVIRRISPDGLITTFAGNGRRGFSGDGGPARNASLSLFSYSCMNFDSAGTLYLADSGNNRIRTVSREGIIQTIAGGGTGGDGVRATQASLYNPYCAALDPAGALYIADTRNYRIRKVGLDGVISSVAGSQAFRAFREGTPNTEAFLFAPRDLIHDNSGNLVFADSLNHKVRRLASGGGVFTVAGGGTSFPGTTATAAFFSSPTGLKYDAGNILYISDDSNNSVRRILPDGRVERVAGPAALGESFSGDGGPAVSAALDRPRGLEIDEAGNLYIADANNHRIRRVSPNGIIDTYAGTGVAEFRGDGGAAARASLSSPTSLLFDSRGNLLVADSGNNRIRMISRTGEVSTIAGSGASGLSTDGIPAISAALNRPTGVCLDPAGNLFIVESGGNRVRRVSLAGIITTVAGNGTAGFSGDGGPATAASLRAPYTCKFHAGQLYISDEGNDRIRVVSFTGTAFTATPISLTLDGRSGGAMTGARSVTLSSAVSGLPFTIAASTSDGAQWLKTDRPSGVMPASIDVFADPSGLRSGTYRGTVTITAPNAPSVSIAVTLTVAEPDVPRPRVESSPLSFSLSTGSAIASSSVQVRNDGGGSFTFTAAATTPAGGEWLSVAPASGSVTATTNAVVNVQVDPRRLAPGTYTGKVTVASSAPGEPVVLPVTITVAPAGQNLLLSQTGLTYTAVVDGGAVLPQSFGVLNLGPGVMTWTVRASTLSGGSQWLSASPLSGSSDGASLEVPLVDVGIDASGLSPGEYYGQIEVSAPGAENSPQLVSVVLNVLPRGSNPGPVVRPTGLIFTASADTAPSSQNVLVANPGGSPISFASSRLTFDGQNWFLHAPANATVLPERPTRIVVQADTANLIPGVRRGVLTLLFQDGTTRAINLLFVVVRQGAGTTAKKQATADCAPTQLLPVVTSLGANFSVPAAWPVAVEARIIDDCGNPMTAGSATLSFSNGDSPVPMVSLRDGRWSGTWQVRNSAQSSGVTMTLTAEQGALRATAQVSGDLRANPNAPILASGGITNAASLVPRFPLSPGAVVSIFGARLASRQEVATRLPLETQLGDTAVILGGQRLPLLYASENQVNALIPFQTPANRPYQLVVRRGSSNTTPEAVVVADAQPAVFTKSQLGNGQGIIVDTQNRLVEPGNPAASGDTVVIYCSGLGAVDAALESAQPAPQAPLARAVNPVRVTIGGRESEVTFAGLVPGMLGLYQVNAVVPSGVERSEAMEVVVSVAGKESPPVTIATR